MKISTTFRHKTHSDALKKYVLRVASNLGMYTSEMHRVDIVFAMDSKSSDGHQTSCHIALHLLGKENIDTIVVCKNAKDAFDQAYNLVRCELSHANKYRSPKTFKRAI